MYLCSLSTALTYATLIFTPAIAAPVTSEPQANNASDPNIAAALATIKAFVEDVHGIPLPEELARNKYFHEPGTDNAYGHYDSRFFNATVSYDERTTTLQHMIRAYLGFFHDKGLDTWIAHGTLLGWWWNGKLLPWDWDIDTQVSGETLRYMRDNFNMTRHQYVDKDYRREYLLDVNPWSRDREHGDGMNIIDARWIDTQNGLYIDITGLSALKPQDSPGVWSCKNRHDYRTMDLYPMRMSTYEGVPAKIPYAYDKILMDEYEAKALVLREYQGHVWNEQQRLWIKKSEKSSEHEPEPERRSR